MYNEDMIKKMMELFANPLFKKSFYDYFMKVQMEGIEAARKFWNLSPEKNTFDVTPEIFEKMVDFYIILGFVPRFKYEDLHKENERLGGENAFLRSTLKELQMNVLKEGGERVQEAWRSIIERQFDINKEVSKNFFELFRNLTSRQQEQQDAA